MDFNINTMELDELKIFYDTKNYKLLGVRNSKNEVIIPNKSQNNLINFYLLKSEFENKYGGDSFYYKNCREIITSQKLKSIPILIQTTDTYFLKNYYIISINNIDYFLDNQYFKIEIIIADKIYHNERISSFLQLDNDKINTFNQLKSKEAKAYEDLEDFNISYSDFIEDLKKELTENKESLN